MPTDAPFSEHLVLKPMTKRKPIYTSIIWRCSHLFLVFPRPDSFRNMSLGWQTMDGSLMWAMSGFAPIWGWHSELQLQATTSRGSQILKNIQQQVGYSLKIGCPQFQLDYHYHYHHFTKLSFRSLCPQCSDKPVERNFSPCDLRMVAFVSLKCRGLSPRANRCIAKLCEAVFFGFGYEIHHPWVLILYDLMILWVCLKIGYPIVQYDGYIPHL